MSRFFGGRFGDMIPSSSNTGLADNSGVFSSRQQYTSKQEGGWAGESAISASGGTTSTYNDPTGQTWKVHKFESSGSFVVTAAGSGTFANIEYLLIAGGAGGGGIGGGGAGGLIYKTGTPVSVATYPVTIGSGGAAFDSPGGVTPAGNAGADSVFALSTPVTAKGGSGGAGWDTGSAGPGGSGGGGGTPNSSETGGSGTGPGHPGGVDIETPAPFITAGGWGNPGGDGTPGAYYGGGGGGAQGAGVGANPGPGVAGGGGNGAQYTILTGNPTTGNRWAGGGGGGNQANGTSGFGGKGGGGGGGGGPTGGSGGLAPNPGDPNFTDYNVGEAGRVTPNPGPGAYGYGGNAGANTGSGGGGMATSVGHGGAGGSGILIVRYKTS